MEETEAGAEWVGGVSPVAHRGAQLKIDRKSRRIRSSSVTGEFAVGRMLKDMKKASGLTTRQIADKLGLTREALNQHFWRYGKGGTSNLLWFLRFAEAVGVDVWLSFPSEYESNKLKNQAKSAKT